MQIFYTPIYIAIFLFSLKRFVLNCRCQARIKTKLPVQDLFFEKQVKCQILLGNFRNIKSKQRKQRLRKMATEKFSAAFFVLYVWFVFLLKRFNHPLISCLRF